MIWVSCEGETAADKGGLISERFSCWLHSPKKCAKLLKILSLGG